MKMEMDAIECVLKRYLFDSMVDIVMVELANNDGYIQSVEDCCEIHYKDGFVEGLNVAKEYSRLFDQES